LSELKEKVDQ